MTTPKISIFVLHYDKDELTNTCVNSLIADVYVESFCHIYVIDNGSHKPFALDIYATSAEITILSSSRNMDLIEAYNWGIMGHAADIYVCMANDTRMRIGTIQKLVEALTGEDHIGIAAPGTNDRGAGILFTGGGPEQNPALKRTYPQHVDNTCWAFSEKLMNAIGLPDCEGHTHRACWGSNQDYCYRARVAGWKVAAIRDGYVWHAHNGGEDQKAFKAGRDWLSLKYGQEASKVWGA